jgi:hypothetical protein
MNLKEFSLVVLVSIAVVAIGTWLGGLHSAGKFGDAGMPNYYTSPTMATSSVGIYTPVNLIANSGSVSYRSICNTSPTTTNDLMLELDATSSATGLSAPGILVPGNSCYEFLPNKLFTGNVYGIFTTSTATVSSLYK